jgi:uncharacterized protein YjbJ (UPF0337 family)
MTKDRTSRSAPASAEQRKASVTEALGKLTGDAGVEAEGRRQRREAGAGKARDAKSAGPDRARDRD